MSCQPSRLGIKQLALTVFIVSLILIQTDVNAITITPIAPNTSTASVSPGKSDLLLGNDFPTLSSVKLSYPDSAILTNSVGDLLFSVKLNPLMLNLSSAQVFSASVPSPQVQVWGSGFSVTDTSCTLSGFPVPVLPITPCLITPNPTYGGILTASFNVPPVPPGTYTITAKGFPTNDFSSAPFTVLPPSLVLDPSSGPAGTAVTASGIGFYSTSCSLTGQVVSSPTACSISSGVLATGTPSFKVPATASPGTYIVTVATNGADSNEARAAFTVTQTTAVTSLSPSVASIGTTITVTGSGFSSTDTTCVLSGSPVGSPTTCSISGGVLTGSFVASSTGTYTITATGSPANDFATTDFQAYPTAAEPPISVSVSLDIYIPPEFTGLTIGNVWSSFTNNYDSHSIRLSRQSSADEIAPNWWDISIQNLIVTHSPNSYLSPLVGQRVFRVAQTQYVRLFQVTSPTTAGRYFFKAFINGVSIGAENFPTLVVKASRDPATISGTLRDLGDRNPTRAGQPIFLAPGTGAEIIATGDTPLGQRVSAQTFINSTADGTYTLFGVAAGTYNITVYAAGYIPITITQFPYPYPFNPTVARPTPITVAPAQSLEGIDVYLSDSSNVTGTVLSENAQGLPVPWGTVSGFSGIPTPRAITVQLVSLAGTTVVATNVEPFGFTAATTPTATDYHFSIQNELSSWNGEIPQDFANFTSGLPTGEDYFVRAYVNAYVQLAEVRVHVANATVETEAPVPLIRTGIISVTVHFKDSNFTGSDLVDDSIKVSGTLTVSAYDMQGVLRAQNTTAVPVGSRNAYIELLGISSASQRGIVSQFSQNYGILPGTYYIEARFTSRPPVIGNAATTTNAVGDVGDLYYQLAPVLASIGLGQGDIEVSFPIYRAAGIQLTICSIDDQIPPLYRDWGFPGQPIYMTFIPTTETFLGQTNATQTANSACTLLNIAGLQAGSYDVVVRTIGYTQWNDVHFTVPWGTNADASIKMIVNPVITLTVAFRDEGLLTGINSTEPYAQPINDIDATPARVEVFDYLGDFVAANVSYIPNISQTGAPTRVANFTLAGFSIYYGDPRYVWSGFYDTTDQASQQAGGLLVYPWELSQTSHEFEVRVWVDGYYQLEPLRVTVATRGNVSATLALDRASRISGTIAGPDFFDYARPLSWATVDLEPYNYTLSGIIDVAPGNYTTTSLDGFFQVWVPQGTYGMGVLLAGYTSYQAQLAVPAGSDISLWIWLENYQTSTQTTSASTGTGTPASELLFTAKYAKQ